jgi:hypothetical protein
VGGIGQNQEHMVGAAIALAFANAAREGLNIAHPGFSLNAYKGRIESEQHVPGPSVARAWQQRFAKDAVRRGGHNAKEPTNERLLGLVCDWIAAWMQGEVKLHAKGRGDLGQRGDRHVEKPARLEAADVRLGTSIVGAELFLADARSLARRPKLRYGAANELLAPAPPALVARFSGGHEFQHGRRRFTAAYPDV